MLQIHYFSFSCSSCCGVAAAIAPAAALLGASAATDLQAGACKARVCKEAVIQCWGSKNCTSMQPNQREGVRGVAGVPKGRGAMSSSAGSSSSRSTGRLGILRPATPQERRRQQQRGGLTPVANLSHHGWLKEARHTQTTAMLLHKDGIAAHVQKQQHITPLGAICLISLGRAHHGWPAAGAMAWLPAKNNTAVVLHRKWAPTQVSGHQRAHTHVQTLLLRYSM